MSQAWAWETSSLLELAIISETNIFNDIQSRNLRGLHPHNLLSQVMLGNVSIKMAGRKLTSG